MVSAGPSIGAGGPFASAQAFIDRIKEYYGGAKIEQELSSSREPAPDVNRICAFVCAFYSVERPGILKARRGRLNEPRNTAIYLVRKLRRDTFGQIARAFETSTDSTVSSGCADEEKACNRTRTV